MLTPTNYTVNPNLFQEALTQLPERGMKTTINKPTGNFFYDPWELKDEYKDTGWETIYNSLPVAKGEARIIILDSGQAYQSHADIDDRYHLNISGDNCFLINLDREQIHRLSQDGIWYDMNAGFIHSAVNLGRPERVQLVVRKLLSNNSLIDPVELLISTEMSDTDHARFLFDNTVSPWLNLANKKGFINNFSYSPSSVKFNVEKNTIESLKQILPTEFKIL
jgi:hypothetical protein